MTKIKAVLFDLDGTLLDTSEYILQAFEFTFDLHKIPKIDRSEIVPLIGLSLPEMYQRLTNLDEVDHFRKTHNDFQLNNLHLIKSFLQTNKTLAELTKRGYKLAVITMRFSRSTQVTLKQAKILSYFDVIITPDDVKNVKPHPEPLLTALSRFGVDPTEAIMVGDTDLDVMAGKNAGTKTVGVTYGFHGKRIADSKPDYVVDDIGDLLNILT